MNFEVMILAGGLGTRLRPVLQHAPKPMAQVCGRPFLTCLLDQIESIGARQVILCTGYMGEVISTEIGPRWGRLDIRYSHEESPLGTAGALGNALPMLGADRAMVLNGDSLIDADLKAFVQWHMHNRYWASMMITHVQDSSRFGTVEWRGDRSVSAFHEKARNRGEGWINAGVYVMDRDALESIPETTPCSLETEVFPRWIDGRLGTWPTDGVFLDIGTPETLAQSQSVVHELLFSRS